ncbi:MAG: hypothetical protein RBT63_04005 [Bdellovibrionales bacterium]|jgi:hypothetical protein|nr:hypothetical protein [Bdellovibrionales bacterium]
MGFLLRTVLSISGLALAFTLNTARAEASAVQPLLASSASETYYDTLAEMFQTGVQPDISKVVEIFWKGRCFVKQAPDTPIATAYHIREVVEDVGPISRRKYEAASIWNMEARPDFYNDISLAQLTKPPRYNPLTVTSRQLEARNGTAVFALRASGKYLVEELNDPPVYGYCYYFIPGL